MRAVQTWSSDAVDMVVRLCTEHRNQKGNTSVGDKEDISSDGWTVVRKNRKTKSLVVLSQLCRGFSMALFLLRFVNQGRRVPWLKCFRSQVSAHPNGFQRLSFFRSGQS